VLKILILPLNFSKVGFFSLKLCIFRQKFFNKKKTSQQFFNSLRLGGGQWLLLASLSGGNITEYVQVVAKKWTPKVYAVFSATVLDFNMKFYGFN